MKKKSHIILGFFAVFCFILALGYFNFNLFSFDIYSVSLIVIISLFYSILPDIDHKSGTITWIFIGLSFFTMLLGIFEFIFGFGKPILLMAIALFLLFTVFLAANFFEHRGFIHSITAGLIAVIPLWFLFQNLFYCYVAYVAWYSHLIGDGFFLKFK